MSIRSYICIDLKSFYASVECVLRHLNPLTTNLVVADVNRTQKTICLAVSHSLKAYKIPGRARLFEVVSKVKEINQERLKKAPFKYFVAESSDSNTLSKHPEYQLSFIAATPQMAKYIEFSTRIYSIYLKYIASEDIHVYSIDEVFMDATSYLKALGLTAYELAQKIILEIYEETGITATAGIGTNMYLAKVAMDIVAKHTAPDDRGARIATLDEMKYRKTLWNYEPLSDFWRVGRGYIEKLNNMGLMTMGDIARCSIGSENSYYNEKLLFDTFGINAELLIDHAWGYEPTTIKDIKAYQPNSSSMSVGQVIHCAYDFSHGLLIVKEMADILALDLVKRGVYTNQLVLNIGYDIDNLKDSNIKENYHGEIKEDMYGRQIPKSAHGTINLDSYTQSTEEIINAVSKLYNQIVDKNLLVRRVHITATKICENPEAEEKEYFYQLNLFTDYDKKEKEDAKTKKRREKEARARKTILSLKEKFGKNAVIKGMNLEDGGTTIDRNKQIGGHKA